MLLTVNFRVEKCSCKNSENQTTILVTVTCIELQNMQVYNDHIVTAETGHGKLLHIDIGTKQQFNDKFILAITGRVN